MFFGRNRVLLASLVATVALVGIPLYVAKAAQPPTGASVVKTAFVAKTAPVKAAPTFKTVHRAEGVKRGKARDYWYTPGLNQFATMSLEGFEEALVSDQSYGGVQIVLSGVLFNYVGEPSAAFTAKLATLPKALDWKLRKVSNSLASLTRLTAQMGADHKAWASRGVTMSSWGPDNTTNKVTVTLAVSKVSYRIQAAKLKEAYGKDMLEVAAKPDTIMPAIPLAQRRPAR